MAIVEMQKMSICAEKKKRKDILEFLQKVGAMEIDVSESASQKFEKIDTSNDRMRFEKIADSMDHAVKLLKKEAPAQRKKLLSLELEQITSEEENEIIQNRRKYYADAMQIADLEKEMSESRAVIARKENKITSLIPWQKLDIPLNSSGTKKTKIMIGTFPEIIAEDKIYEAVLAGMHDSGKNAADDKVNTENVKSADFVSLDSLPVDINILSAENQVTNVAVIAANALSDKVEEALRTIGFVRIPYITHRVPQESLDKCKKEIQIENQKIEKAREQIISFADEIHEFKIASDYFRSRAEKYRVLGEIPQSRTAFFIEGWVQKSNSEAIGKILEEKYEAAVEMEETMETDDEPVILHNNKFSESVEGVLESYGLPQHKKVDPTFVMSIFYVFFFGMMLSDAAYGMIMSIACGIVLLKFKRIPSGMKKTMKLFFSCGLSTVFWGFMFGGFFGDAIDVIAKTFFGYTGGTILKPLWFNPLSNPMRLLIWCMLFGLIHLYAGLAMKGYEILKEHDIKSFLCDIVSWYLFLTGLILILLPTNLFASIAGQSYIFPAWLSMSAKIMALTGLVVIVFTSGRGHKNWGLRIALGLYDVYGVTGWLSDVLSYSRLLALGLATGVIAQVINMIASMGGNTPIGVIVFIIVFIFGHIMNMAINLLGAYVHTNRLQFVEFFGKFYDAGGRPFHPFKTIHKYVEIKED